MKKLVAGIAFCGLSACQTVTTVPIEELKNDCETVFEAKAEELKVRYSQEIKIASKLACYYGNISANAKITCSIPVDIVPIFDTARNDTGGLHDSSSALIIASEGVGEHMAYRDAIALLKGGLSDKDPDQCLQAIHDQPSARLSVRDMFPRLRKMGY